MKRCLLTVISALFASLLTCNAQFGVWQSPEWQTKVDEQTRVELTVLTDIEKNDRYFYQTDPMWSYDMKYLMFRSSSRSAGSEREMTLPDGRVMKFSPTHTYIIEVATGRIMQVTEGDSNVYIGNKSNTLFFSRMEQGKWCFYSEDLDQLLKDADKGKAKSMDKYMTLLGTFPDSREMGRPGSFCVSSDDSWAYITVRREGTPEEIARMNAAAFVPRDDQPKKTQQQLSGIRKMDLKTGEVSMVVNCEFSVGHIQCSRFHPEEIVFCCETGGDANQRMWYVKADGSEFKPLYVETPLDWVTHETFGTEDYVYFNILGWQDRLRKQASGIFRINLRTDDVDCLGNVEMDMDRSSQLTGRGFWHCNSTRDGSWATGDTFAGNVWVIDVATGHRYQIASDTKMNPDHAQPFFSPDGRYLCFQSGHWSDGTRLNLVMVDLSKVPFLPAR